jgi:neutral trehalase
MNEVLWDAAAGFYFDRNERTGERVTIKSAAGLLPLWAGIASPDRARRLVEDHLTNPMEFWLEYPVACWSKDEPDYYQQRQGGECNWRGTCWVPVNYMLFHGLIDAGYRDLAGEVAYRTCNMASAEETTREYYNAETGCGQGLNPFWGWSALAYLMPLEFELGHDPTVATPEKLASPCRDLLGLAFPPRECSLNP